MNRLREGLEQNIPLILAKAVLGLNADGVPEGEIVRAAALFCAKARDDWGGGLTVLTAASLAYAGGAPAIGAGMGLLVAALALTAAATGFCTGCEAYKLACRLTGSPFVSCPLPPQTSRAAR